MNNYVMKNELEHKKNQHRNKNRRVTRHFLGQESFLKLGYFDKQSSTIQKRKAPQGKFPGFFTGKLLKIAL